MQEDFSKLLQAWDELDQAANRIVTALPFQMTEAAERLEVARKGMREAIYQTFAGPQSASKP